MPSGEHNANEGNEMRRAYSYIRFSTPDQIQGDSLRRQAALTEKYCQKHDLTLDTSLSLRDLGVSAFRGTNAATGALAAFLEGVQSGKITKGSILILENLDRLTRNEIGEALTLFIGILSAGIEIVTLDPERTYTKANINDLPVIIEAIMTFCLGHEESRKKSSRLTSLWEDKRKLAKTAPVAIRAPAWLSRDKDRNVYVIDQKKAALVKRIFKMADDGQSISHITKTLNIERNPGFSGRGLAQSAIGLLLRSRTVLGEYQPHTGRYGTRKPVGDPIPGYYPRIIADDQFYCVQNAIASRRAIRGRAGVDISNLFSGLVWDALDGHSMTMVQKHKKKLVSAGAVRGIPGCRYLPVDYQSFERAFMVFIDQLKVSDIVQADDNQADEIGTLSGKLASLTHKIGQIQTRIDQAEADDTDILLDTLGKVAKQRKQVLADLERAKQQQTSNEAETLGECGSLSKLLLQCDPSERLDLRRKIRQRIRSLVEEIWIKAETEDADPKYPVHQVQVWFKTGKSKGFIVGEGMGFPALVQSDLRREKTKKTKAKV